MCTGRITTGWILLCERPIISESLPLGRFFFWRATGTPPKVRGRVFSGKAHMKRYFITGILIWVPLVITIWVLKALIETLDQTLLILPPAYRPEALIGMSVPGFGVLLTVVILFFTGVLGANVLGQRIVNLWERGLSRIPIVKSIYNSVKQVSEAIFSNSRGDAFKKVVLVRFPHAGIWTLAFQTALPGKEVATRLGEAYIGVYVPTTPNPTGGYYILVRRDEVIELDIGVDVAFKYIISMGVANK